MSATAIVLITLLIVGLVGLAVCGVCSSDMETAAPFLLVLIGVAFIIFTCVLIEESYKPSADGARDAARALIDRAENLPTPEMPRHGVGYWRKQ